MESIIHLDTHAVVYLYAGQLEVFTKRTISILEKSLLCISDIVRLELQYLLEINRITANPGDIVSDLSNEIGLVISSNTSQRVIDKAISIDFTRDPFDRIIVADAMLEDAMLVTKDRKIAKFYHKTIW